MSKTNCVKFTCDNDWCGYWDTLEVEDGDFELVSVAITPVGWGISIDDGSITCVKCNIVEDLQHTLGRFKGADLNEELKLDIKYSVLKVLDKYCQDGGEDE